MGKDLDFTLIDGATGLVCGPYDSFDQARERADDFATWEILNADGDLVDWSRPPEAREKAEAA
jgi:hypothetical protein